MTKFLALIALAAAAPIPAVAAVAQDGAATTRVAVQTGRMLYSADGRRVGAVYRVQADGSAQLIVSGRLVTIPASTLSVADGKITTTLNRAQIR